MALGDGWKASRARRRRLLPAPPGSHGLFRKRAQLEPYGPCRLAIARPAVCCDLEICAVALGRHLAVYPDRRLQPPGRARIEVECCRPGIGRWLVDVHRAIGDRSAGGDEYTTEYGIRRLRIPIAADLEVGLKQKPMPGAVGDGWTVDRD